LLVGLPGASHAQPEAPPLSCFRLLEESGEVDESLATQLCQGAQSTAPADCLLRLQDNGDLSIPQAVQLCQYAGPSDDPAGCYLQAREQTFIDSWRAIRLCQPAVNLNCPSLPAPSVLPASACSSSAAPRRRLARPSWPAGQWPRWPRAI
jgi:hypothetical protein